MKNGLLKCSMQCMHTSQPCQQKQCKHFIEFEEEYNCTLVAIYENGAMTLRQIGERIGVSFARVKQIESKALEKIKGSSLNSFLN